ncbi:MAG TPA: zinc-ribbon domain containing protein [Patescibacteria group bacterium]|nr:zinc-ribbon domain containing protein [Patescibacteria group bacterium]
MAFQDKTLTCRDCGKDFTFTASEQQFYQDKGFTNAPTRCPDCRRAHKAQRQQGGGGYNAGGPRQSFEITCSECGKKGTVPFQPKGDRPVLCRECFDKQRSQRAA